MKQLIIEDLSYSIGVKSLFKNLSFTISKADKVGLIGINGTGKSTLLSVIAGFEGADTMKKDHPNDYRIAYLPQDPEVDPSLTVLETVFKSDAPIIKMNLTYEKALANLSKNPTSDAAQKQYEKIQLEMDAQNGWDLNARAKTILSKLGITTYDKTMGKLSGGQQKRVALAGVLIEPADLLLLDEPTNHLDIQSITWLQDFLANLKGAVIFITHDRYFLDALSTHIYELAGGNLYTHSGNYGDFLEAKALREEEEKAAESKLRNRYRSELKWIQRGALARSTKQKARINRFEALKADLQKDNYNEKLDVNLKTSRLGRKVIEVEQISKAFKDKIIIDDFTTILQQGDRIAIIGPNGAGKTTLMKLLSGDLAPDHGSIDRGSTVKIAHFQQHIPNMDQEQRMIEYIREASNDIEDADGVRVSASQMLERFLFPSHVHGSLLGQLSGGEKKRLYLLKLLMEEPNVLLLDEPTNDLDLETLGILEQFIETFPGLVITISHDRFFLDRTSRELWILDGSGKVEIKQGIYSDYLAASQLKDESPEAELASIPEVTEEITGRKQQKRRRSYHESKEWERIDQDIEAIEMSIEKLEAEIGVTASDYEKLSKLTQKLDEKNERYEALIERWDYLQSFDE